LRGWRVELRLLYARHKISKFLICHEYEWVKVVGSIVIEIFVTDMLIKAHFTRNGILNEFNNKMLTQTVLEGVKHRN
jgi:hypothetical protein